MSQISADDFPEATSVTTSDTSQVFSYYSNLSMSDFITSDSEIDENEIFADISLSTPEDDIIFNFEGR